MTETAPSLRDAQPPTVRSILDAVAKETVSAEQVMSDCLERIDRLEPAIRAFVDLRGEEAIATARAADARAPADRGPLHGLPVAVKEVFDVAGMRCRWGSRVHENRVPAADAVAVARLKEAGAIIVGTVVSTEYAIADAGPTVNPVDTDRTPGGSSSGPAAAVASGMVPVALGSQTVGSIVRPAAYCGVFGLKPTLGAIPGRGGMPLSARLDHPGLIASDPDAFQPLCRVLFGVDPDDPWSRAIAPPESVPPLTSVTVLVAEDAPPDPVSEASRAAVRRAADALAIKGAQVEDFSFPDKFASVVDVLYTIMTRDMALAHGADYDSHAELMSPHLRDLIERGRRTSDADYEAAVAVAELWRDLLDDLLGADSVILSPATCDVAPPLSAGTGSNRPQALWSLVGLPVGAAPSPGQGGLPLAVQVGAGAGREALILAVSGALAQ